MGRKGVYITRTYLHDNFQIWSFTYLNCSFSIGTCVAEGLHVRQGLDIERSKVRTLLVFFCLFCVSFLLLFPFTFLVWKFDVVFFVGLLVVVFFLWSQ